MSKHLTSKEQLAEILSDAHAIHCAAEVGMPCDCRVPDAIAELLRRAEPPSASREQQLLTELAYWKARCGVMHGDETNAVTKSAQYIPGAVCGRMDCEKPVPVGNAFCDEHENPKRAAHETSERECGCYDCSSIQRRMSTMIVCPECGNKRCPKATSHMNACTKSNDSGQPGSRY